MKKYLSFILIFLSLFAFHSVSQQCLSDSGQPQADLFQTGTYTLTNPTFELQLNGPSQQSCFDIPLSFTPTANKPYSIILSPLQISSQQNLLTDFSLRSFKKQKSFTVVLASWLNDWKSYTFSYLITSRDEFVLGNFILNGYELIGCGNNEPEIKAKYLISTWTKPYAQTQTVIVRLFLSGIRTIYSKNTGYLDLSIKNAQINLNKGQITFRLKNSNLNNLLNIEFNYLIYSQSSFKYDMEQTQLKSSGIAIKSSFKYPSLYIFGGLTTFNAQKQSKTLYNAISFYEIVIPCKGSKCRKTCIAKKQCLQKLGKIINDTKGSQQCLLQCGQNQTYNSANQCQCNYGFQRKNTTCQKIQLSLNCNPLTQNINFTTRSCQCNNDYIKVDGKCQVRCNINGFVNGSKCQCLTGYRELNGWCHNCTQYVDQVNKKCKCSQPDFYMAFNGTCVRTPCKNNLIYFPLTGKCSCYPENFEYQEQCWDFCGENYYRTAFGCTCVPGFTFVASKNACYKKANCTKANQVIDPTGYFCLCKDGFQRDPVSQACIAKCGSNQVLQANKLGCDCEKGFQRDPVSKKCIQIILNCNQSTQIYDINIQSCRCRDGFIRNTSNICIPTSNTPTKTCNLNQQLIISTQQCVCKSGYQRSPSTNLCEEIPAKTCLGNSTLKNNDCICNTGFVKVNEQCVSVCTNANQVFNESMNLCQCQNGYGRITGKCIRCPKDSITKNDLCSCLMGLVWNQTSNVCELNCSQNSTKKLISLANSESVYICQCNAGYVQNALGKCDKIPDPVCPTPQAPKNLITCPGTSVWDPVNFKCFCNSTSLFLIGGTCKPCDQNQGWNGNQCVCLTGFNMINSKCQRCDINSVYRGGKCNCNFGYYDQNPSNIENTICRQCHPSCATCKGSLDSDCLTCIDPEAIFSAGKCVSNPNCPKGFFNSTSGCKKCNEYCAKCKDENQCTECISGFSLEQVNILGTINAFCPEICGDGKRYEYECDDGNTKDGDGCDSQCNVEKGWSCGGGTGSAPSVCVKTTSTKAILSITKPLRLIGSIAQGVTLSYIPDELSQNLCVNCNDTILVKLVSYKILPSVKVQYLPTTRYKFLITFTFSGIFAIPDFVYSVQINPKYEKYFSVEDMSQKLIIPVNPADLAINNPEDQLTLDQVSNPFNIF